MAAKLSASIMRLEIEDTDEMYRLNLYSYTSEDGSDYELTGDYFGPDGLAEARRLALHWRVPGQADLIRSASRLRVPDAEVRMRFMGYVPLEEVGE